MLFGRDGEIRTHGRLAPLSVFKTDPLNHSGTSPKSALQLPKLTLEEGVAEIISASCGNDLKNTQ